MVTEMGFRERRGARGRECIGERQKKLVAAELYTKTLVLGHRFHFKLIFFFIF